MREDYMEKLDKMFPNGYVISYTCPNETVRLSLYNPHGYELLEKIRQALIDLSKNGEDE